MVTNSPLIPVAAPGTFATQDAVPWINGLKLPHQFGPVGQKKLNFGIQEGGAPWDLLSLKFFPIGALSVLSPCEHQSRV